MLLSTEGLTQIGSPALATVHPFNVPEPKSCAAQALAVVPINIPMTAPQINFLIAISLSFASNNGRPGRRDKLEESVSRIANYPA